MSYFDIARDLANALNKAVNGAKTLSSSPTPTEQVGAYIAEISALSNAFSAAANGLKSILPAGAIATVSGANALVNITNLEVQTALLNQSIESGDTRKIIATSLDFASAVAGVIGSIPSPLAPEAKAIAIALSAISSLYKNRADIAEGLNNIANETNNLLDGIGNDLSNAFIKGALNLGNQINHIESTIASLFNSTHTYTPANVPTKVWEARRSFSYDPLTLDLDGDGIETHGIDPAQPIYFDHTGAGVAQASGWISADDGFLVLDRNGNGLIDNGTELFGDSTPLADGGKAFNGFHALFQEDTNQDGWVDANDQRYAGLKVWRDLNQNGSSEADELKTLAESGIQALKVDATPNFQLLNNGNVLADVGSFIRSDGSSADMGTTQQLGDVDLASDTFLSRFIDTIPLTEQALALPGMRGSGQVRDMREAASLSGDFAAVLTQYAAGASKADQLTMLDALLETWANTSTMSATTWIEHTSTGFHLNATDTAGMVQVTRSLPEERQALSEDLWRKLTVLERFNGRQNAFLGSTFSQGTMNGLSIYAGQIPLIEAAYQSLRDSVYRGLLLQTRFKPALEAISLTLNDAGLAFDFSGMDAWLIENAAFHLTAGIGNMTDSLDKGNVSWVVGSHSKTRRQRKYTNRLRRTKPVDCRQRSNRTASWRVTA